MNWGLTLQNGGLIPAIESAHAFAVLGEMKFKPECVVINLSGRGMGFKYLY
jgi:tryptophan synthase beta chain